MIENNDRHSFSFMLYHADIFGRTIHITDLIRLCRNDQVHLKLSSLDNICIGKTTKYSRVAACFYLLENINWLVAVLKHRWAELSPKGTI